MKRIVAILALAICSTVAANASTSSASNHVPHDHTPTIHSSAPQPHK